MSSLLACLAARGGLGLAPASAAVAAAAPAIQLLRHRAGYAAMHQPVDLPQGLGKPSGPSTAATGSRSGLGHFGGAKADYDKYPQGPGQPVPEAVSPLGPKDPDEEKRANKDLHLTPHGYVPVRRPEGKHGGGE